MAKNSSNSHDILPLTWFRQWALAFITICTLASSAIILYKFIAPITWGIALAITIQPLYRRILRRAPNRTTVSLLFTFVLGIGVIIPTVWATHLLISTAIEGLRSVSPASVESLWNDFLKNHPETTSFAERALHILPLDAMLTKLSLFVENQAQHIVRSSIKSIFNTLLTLAVVFFSLRDGSAFLRGLRALIPLSARETDAVLRRILDTIHGVIFGIIAIALLQGALGAALLWWLEIQNILIWTVIMTLLALVPYLGTFIVWLPLAVFLLLQGSWLRGVFAIGWGSIIIGLSDNIIYPWLVGKKIHYHPLILFLFLFGGMLTVGASGVILGPIVLATSERLLWIWRKRA
jgi:predicted PurR-regulated permease PerM